MMQPRDSRYELIKPMLKEGKITTFQDIFKYIKKSVVAADLQKGEPVYPADGTCGRLRGERSAVDRTLL